MDNSHKMVLHKSIGATAMTPATIAGALPSATPAAHMAYPVTLSPMVQTVSVRGQMSAGRLRAIARQAIANAMLVAVETSRDQSKMPS